MVKIVKKIAILFFSFLALCLMYVYIPRFWFSPNEVLINVYSGMSAQRVAELLKKERIIYSTTPFLYWLEVLGAESDIKAGTYKVDVNSSLNGIIQKIINCNFYLII